MTHPRSEDAVRHTLKEALVADLHLQDLRPEDIDDNAPLFTEGLGLDSLDAVELVVLLEKHFGVRIASAEEGREAFTSIAALAGYIIEQQCIAPQNLA